MEDETNAPWWKTTLRGMGLLFGLLLLSALLMGGIMLVARFLDKASQPSSAVSAPRSSTAPEKNARTRAAAPLPYAPQSWPDSPSRRSAEAGATSTGSRAPAAPSRPSVPVGLSADEYQAAVADGKTVYLPDPKGECNLSGTNTANSLHALESCFARQAAR